MATQSLARTVDRIVASLAKHWLAALNAAMAVILGLGLLAPWLMLHGQERAGEVLYRAYGPTCHQLPERSFFLGGQHPWYTLPELTARLGYEAPLRYLGDPELGYKVAFCERDVAIYAGWLLGGLGFGLFRKRIKPLPWWGLVLLVLPMGIDGTIQLLGLGESNWWRRSVTGLLFALGIIWFVYPLLERGMAEAQTYTQRSMEEPGAER